MGDVIELDCYTRLDLPPDKILENAKEKLNSVVLIGWDEQGELYFAGSYADARDVLWIIEKAKQLLFKIEELKL